MSAAEALPPVSPWRDTSHLGHIPTVADLAVCPPPNEAGRASHDAALQRSLRAAEPFGLVDSYYDALDDAETRWEALVEAAAEAAATDRAIDWPTNEPERWS